jgi:hypothetical protein
MLRATMPEATVDEDRYVCTSERDVGDPARLREDRDLNAVAETARIQLAA